MTISKKKYWVNISVEEFQEVRKNFLKSTEKNFDDFFADYENEKWRKIFMLEKNYINPVNKFNVKRFFDKSFINEICKEKIKNRENVVHFKSLQNSLNPKKDEITPEQIQNAKRQDMKQIIEWYWISVKQKFCKCPFHWDWSEKTWSLKVYSDNFFCHSCKVWWDTIRFVQKYEWIWFFDAVKKLNNI